MDFSSLQWAINTVFTTIDMTLTEKDWHHNDLLPLIVIIPRWKAFWGSHILYLEKSKLIIRKPQSPMFLSMSPSSASLLPCPSFCHPTLAILLDVVIQQLSQIVHIYTHVVDLSSTLFAHSIDNSLPMTMLSSLWRLLLAFSCLVPTVPTSLLQLFSPY